MSEDRGLKAFFREVCYYGARIRVLFVLCVVFFFLSLVGAVGLEPGTGDHVVAVLNTVVLATLSVFFATIIYLCGTVFTE